MPRFIFTLSATSLRQAGVSPNLSLHMMHCITDPCPSTALENRFCGIILHKQRQSKIQFLLENALTILL